jgi:hypothetical protein
MLFLQHQTKDVAANINRAGKDLLIFDKAGIFSRRRYNQRRFLIEDAGYETIGISSQRVYQRRFDG